ncbi:carboxypeptidase regulatory-like domain-containing protein [Flavobacterium sp. NPDC079362]|uniref:carboxypeptidase regulatory-like domain-containing protein n=1 Tax=Flavobacterium sp. NPDC079362 TaxID=3390566 RepID=UPI003D008533
MTKHYTIEFFKFEKLSKILFLFLSLFALTTSCNKDDAPDVIKPSPGTVKGNITTVENGDYLVGVTVILKQTGQEDKSATVGADGNFTFSNIPAGTISLVSSFPLYISQTTPAVVLAGQTINVSVIMGGDPSLKTLIPDAKFEEVLIKYGYDVAPVDGSIPTYKISKVKELNINDSGIADLTGIQDFKALESFFYSNLYTTSNIRLTSLDLSKNLALKEINVSYNKITTINISKNTALEILKISDNLIANLDLSNLTALTTLQCSKNPLTTLDLSKNTLLKELSFSGNITTIDLSKNTALLKLFSEGGKLNALDVSKNTALEVLWTENNNLTTLDLSKNAALKNLSCDGNNLTTLDLSANTLLFMITCSGNKITTLNVSKNVNLVTLYCPNNLISGLDLSNNPKLTNFHCPYNKLISLDLSKNPLVAAVEGNYFACNNNLLTILNLKNGNNKKINGINLLDNAPTLKIIVDDVEYSNANWKPNKDTSATYISSL